MFLIIKAITNVPDLVIDFVEVKLQSGKIVSLNWDRSSIDRCDEKFVGEYKDVCFDEESADGKLGELHGMQVTEVGLYSETHSAADITIKKMFFEDQGNTISFAGILFSEKARDANG